MISEIETYAKENNVPIMMKDGIEYLCKYIEDNNIKTILEIGSAIGYSSIMMALVDSNIKVTTIEKDKNRYDIAVSNINKFNLSDRITILNEDALISNIKDKFDLIFIDASKGNNINFFNKYKNNLNKKGVIVTDNLSFHGLVENPLLVKTKNQRGLVNKIKLYLEFLDNNEEFTTTYVPVGDRISISIRKDVEYE